nr:hypothetical protein 1634Bnrm2_p090 [Cryptomonas sp.]
MRRINRRASFEFNFDIYLSKTLYKFKKKSKLESGKFNKQTYDSENNFLRIMLHIQFDISLLKKKKKQNGENFLNFLFVLKFRFFHIKTRSKQLQINPYFSVDQINNKCQFYSTAINSVKNLIVRINLLKIKLGKKSIWKKSYSFFSHLCFIFNIVYSPKKVNRIICIGKLIKNIVYELNPEYFQIIFSSSFLPEELSNPIETRYVYLMVIILFTCREILILITRNFEFIKKMKQRNTRFIMSLINFFEIISLKVDFFHFMKKKITLDTKISYLYYQIVDLYLKFSKCTKNSNNYHENKIRNESKKIDSLLSKFCPDLHISFVIYLIIREKLPHLVYAFLSKISRQLYYEKIIEINILDKFFLTLIFIFLHSRLENRIEYLGKFSSSIYEFLCKSHSQNLNLNIIDQVFKLYNKLIKCELLNMYPIILRLLSRIFRRFFQSIDECTFSLQSKKTILRSLKIRKYFVMLFNQKISQENFLKVRERYLYSLNFNIYKFFENTFGDYVYKLNFHNFYLDRWFQNRRYFQNLTLFSINMIISNYIRKFDFCKKFGKTPNLIFKPTSHFNSKRKIFSNNILKKIYCSLSLAFSKKEHEYGFASSAISCLFWEHMKLSINFCYRYTFLTFIFSINFCEKFFSQKNKNKKTEIVIKTAHLCLINRFLKFKYLKAKEKNLLTSFYDHCDYIFCYLSLYLIEKKKMKCNLLLNRCFLFVFCFVLIANSSNRLPKLHINYILGNYCPYNPKFLNKNYKIFIQDIYGKWFFFFKPRHNLHFYTDCFSCIKFNCFAKIYDKNTIFSIQMKNPMEEHICFFLGLVLIWTGLVHIIRKKIFVYIHSKHYVFLLNTFRLDDGLIPHGCFDNKMKDLSTKMKDLNKKIKNNLTKVRKFTPYIFFNSLQTNQLAIY